MYSQIDITIQWMEEYMVDYIFHPYAFDDVMLSQYSWLMLGKTRLIQIMEDLIAEVICD
jgi:hypothetical protein